MNTTNLERTEIIESGAFGYGATDIEALVNNPRPNGDASERETIFSVKRVNAWNEEAAMRKDPQPLWKNLWYEGEVACLFADSNVGKSIYAVQIAEEIAKRQRVLYFDFELTDKQFQNRYTAENGMIYRFSDNFLRSEINPDCLGEGDIEEIIIDDIEMAAIQSGADVLIIDNITYLSTMTESPDSAGRLMMNLMRLKKKHSFSILVLAHTPKRNMSFPITQNDLAGSKKLYNFFDSAFAIGRSAADESMRYIKQLKIRAGEFTHGANNVIVAEIVKEGAFLKFEDVDCGKEEDHLKESGNCAQRDLERQVKGLREEGKTIYEIAEMLGISKSRAGRIVKKTEGEG